MWTVHATSLKQGPEKPKLSRRTSPESGRYLDVVCTTSELFKAGYLQRTLDFFVGFAKRFKVSPAFSKP